MKTVIFSVVLASLFACVQAQPGDTVANEPVKNRRLRTVVIAGTATYGVALAGLSHLWYKESAQQSFSFFNDVKEWKQVDKVGHFYSAFYLSYGTGKLLQWSGVPDDKLILPAAITGFLLLLPIEIMDGYSSNYGASAGDLAANALGAMLYFGQQKAWNAIRIYPKFSYRATDYPEIRPEALGDTFASRLLKDYNAQTYWLSIDADKFFTFPRWLNLAVGYGVHDMPYALDSANEKMGFDPYRQYYFSLDPDLTAIPTNSKAVRTLLTVLNVIKIPSPTVEFSRKGTRFHWLY
ncbi:MAG TPA: DUF2279 domain-containing protein [Cyclobacteriaceae bacterium]|nr:DUF2279 domain-containing protein [Cyclobacteriaceae bacterium]